MGQDLAFLHAVALVERIFDDAAIHGTSHNGLSEWHHRAHKSLAGRHFALNNRRDGYQSGGRCLAAEC